MRIIDAKGLSCPQPLLLTRKALAEGLGDFTVVVDDEIAKKNIERFLNHENKKFEIKREDGEILISVKSEVSNKGIIEGIAEAVDNRPVYVFKTKGVAQDELGQMLTGGFLDTIKDVTPLPEAIVFYHEGVFLVLDDSPFLDKLQVLQELGIKVIICGNCVNFYDVVERVAVGEISNAFDILSILSKAHHLIYP